MPRSQRDPAAQAWSWDETTKRWKNQATGQISDPTDVESNWHKLLRHLPYLAAVPAAGFGAAAASGAFGAGAAGAGAGGGVSMSQAIPPAVTAAGGGFMPYGAADYLGPKPPRGRGVGDFVKRTARNAVTGGDGDGGGSPAWMEAVFAALAGLPGLLANRGPSDEEKQQLEQVRQLQALQQKRIEHQNPLFQAVSQLAMSRLPTSVQRPMGDL